MPFNLYHGDCLVELAKMPDCSIDSVVTDPPYELGFMGKSWDSTGIAYNVEVWEQCLRVLKPGGHLLAFGGSRTYHRLAVAIEDAGFQIRDQIMWVYGSGFPKSLDVSKAINKASGVEYAAKPASGVGFMNNNDDGYHTTLNQLVQIGESTEQAQQWDGWGTALKPAHEPIVLARKPLGQKTVAENVLRYGTGAINIDASRVGTEERTNNGMSSLGVMHDDYWQPTKVSATVTGRFPANFIHDGSNEVLELFPETKPKTLTAARFFYCPKASKHDRNEGLDGFNEQRPDERTEKGMGTFVEKGVAKQSNFHPTVKPTELMRYLCRLVTPPNGIVLDPFTGSGSTGKAAVMEGFSFVGIEQSAEYINIAQARINNATNMGD